MSVNVPDRTGGYGPEVPPPAPPPPGVVSFPSSVTFNHVNQLQRFNVAVPGLPVDAHVWASLDGDPSIPAELAGVQGAYNLGDETVNVLVFYQGAETSLDVPIRIFWAP